MTVPIPDTDKIEQEGKIVVPTAYAMTAAGVSTLDALLMTPAVAIFQPVLKRDDVFNPDKFQLDNFLYYPFERAIGQYDRAYLTMEDAYVNKPEDMLSLWALSVPIVGKFIPGPEGKGNNLNPLLFISGGINDREEGESKRNQATIAGQGMDKNSAKSIRMPFSNAFEIMSELLLGSTALGYDATNQILENAHSEDTIVIQGHSGGVMHMMSASKILGFYDIGVGYASLNQGPFFGTFNNVQRADVYLSLGYKDPTSDIAFSMLPGAIVNKTVQTSVLSPSGQHNQPYWISSDDMARAVKENKILKVGGNEWELIETNNIQGYMLPVWQLNNIPVGNPAVNSPYPEVNYVPQQTDKNKK
jgi:hypothetical protein